MQCGVLAPFSRLFYSDEEETLDDDRVAPVPMIFSRDACDDDDEEHDDDDDHDNDDDSCSTWTSGYDDGENKPHKSVAPVQSFVYEEDAVAITKCNEAGAEEKQATHADNVVGINLPHNSFDVSAAEIVDESPDGVPPAIIIAQCDEDDSISGAEIVFVGKTNVGEQKHDGSTKQKEALLIASDEDTTTVATSLDVTQDSSASEVGNVDDVSENTTPSDSFMEAHGEAKAMPTTEGQNEFSITSTDSPDDEPSLVLNAAQVEWNARYNDLFRYYEKHGTSTISGTKLHVTKHFKLRQWADRQRKAFVRDGLTHNQIVQLVDIHFDFGSDVAEMVAHQERTAAEEQQAEADRLHNQKRLEEKLKKRKAKVETRISVISVVQNGEEECVVKEEEEEENTGIRSTASF